MEMIKANGFDELTIGEMNAVDGGLALTTTLFTALGIKVTVGMALKGGAAVGLTAGGAVVFSN